MIAATHAIQSSNAAQMLRSANTLFDLTLGHKVWDQDSILLLTKYKNIDTLSFAKTPAAVWNL